MKKLILSLFVLGTFSFAQAEKSADCLIIEEENSIICKYINARKNIERKVLFEWFNPNGIISRKREMLVPAGHGSVYDFRYIAGREAGVWTFKVSEDKESYKTTFEIK